MMHMTFYWGKSVTVLFDFWKTDSWFSYAVSLLACILFSVFYQYLEDIRLRFKLLSSLNKTGTSQAAGTDSIPNPNTATTIPLLLKVKGKKWSGARLIGAILFGVNSAIGYLLMLAVMSFNGGVFVAVVLGLAIGYLLFRGGEEDVVLVDSPCACA